MSGADTPQRAQWSFCHGVYPGRLFAQADPMVMGNLAIHLLVLDRGSELHLLEGLPAAWLKPGMVTRLKQVATPFGPLTLGLQVNASQANDIRTPLPAPRK